VVVIPGRHNHLRHWPSFRGAPLGANPESKFLPIPRLDGFRVRASRAPE